MDELRAEFENCAAVLQRINSQCAKLHIELAHRMEAEAVEVTRRVEPLDSALEWRLAVQSLVTHCIARFEATHAHLARQNQRVEHTLQKMDVARPAMSWRVREIDALLAELPNYGVYVTAEDMSAHLWSEMLRKLRVKPEYPDACGSK